MAYYKYMDQPSEFDEFLAQASAAERQREADEAAIATLISHLYEELRNRNIPRYVDQDAETARHLRQNGVEEIVEMARGDTATESSFAGMDEEELREAARHIIATEAELQLTILTTAMQLVVAYERSTAPQAERQRLITEHKKQFMARLAVIDDYEFDDPWMLFFDEITPGEGLDANNPDDLSYLAAALEAVAAREETARHSTALLGKLVAIITAQQPALETEDAAASARALLLRGIVRPPSGNGPAERQAALWDIARQCGLSPQLTSRIITIIEEAYP